jgi:hypothetical protein
MTENGAVSGCRGRTGGLKRSSFRFKTSLAAHNAGNRFHRKSRGLEIRPRLALRAAKHPLSGFGQRAAHSALVIRIIPQFNR